jgi:hypothetical protein
MKYEQLVAEIKDCPRTWLPALLIELVKVAYEKQVYTEGGASRIIRNLEKNVIVPSQNETKKS